MTPVVGPSAWRGADLARDASWLHRLTAAEIADIDAALASWLRGGLRMVDIDRAAARMPALEGRLARIRAELIDGRGIAVLRGLPIERYSKDEVALIYWGLGTHIGEAVTQNKAGDLVCEVRDRGGVYLKDNVRAYESRAALKYHNDNSDAASLLCYRKSKSGGESFVASTQAIYNEILAEHPEYLPPLYDGFIYERRGEEGPGEPPFSRKIPAIAYTRGQVSWRISHSYIEKGSEKRGVNLPPLQRAALGCIEAVARRPHINFAMQLEPGDIQYLNNYTVFHTRNAFEDHDDPAKCRLLMRMWYEIPGIRNFDPKDDILRYEFIRYGNLGLNAEGWRRRFGAQGNSPA